MDRKKEYQELVSRLAQLSKLELTKAEVASHSKEFPKLLDWMNQILKNDIDLDFEINRKETEGEDDLPINSLSKDVILKMANKTKDNYVSAPKPKGRKT
tara:strand:- start:2400 stop:2696 length:297 start_codon:yes stop_codon:yes gene_type:complete